MFCIQLPSNRNSLETQVPNPWIARSRTGKNLLTKSFIYLFIYCTWKYVDYFQIPVGIDFSHSFTVLREQALYDFNTLYLGHETFAPCFMSCSSVSWLIVYGNLNKICILLLCEIVYVLIMLNWFTVVFRSSNPTFLSILLIFESLILKFHLKILICLFKILYSGTATIFKASCKCVVILS